MSELVVANTCSYCERVADQRCPRCEEAICALHMHKGHKGHKGASKGPPLCSECARLMEEHARGRLGSRVAIAASAAVVGMVVSAVVVMIAASAFGLSPEVIVLLMLMAELGCGALSAYAADRELLRARRERAPAELGALPRARLLRGVDRLPAGHD